MTTPALFEEFLHGQPEFDLQRRVSEATALQADEGDLVVMLPGNVVGGTDVDVRILESLVELRLDGLGLGELLRLEPLALQHVEEVGIPGGIELIGPIEGDATVGEKPRQRAMDDGRANLALDVVADDRQARVAEFLRPFRIRGEEDGHAIDHRNASLQARFCVMLDGRVGSDRQIAQQHLGARLAQGLRDVGRLEVGRTKRDIVVVVRHMRGHAVELRTHLDDNVRDGQRTLEDTRVVRLGEDRLLKRPADLADVDVERGDELNIARAIAPHRLAHHAVQSRIAAAPIILNALHQRAGAIADARDGDLDLLLHLVRDPHDAR